MSEKNIKNSIAVVIMLYIMTLQAITVLPKYKCFVLGVCLEYTRARKEMMKSMYE